MAFGLGAKTEDKVPAIAGLTFEQLQACLTAGASLEQVNMLADGGYTFDQIRTLAPTMGGARAGGVSADDMRQLIQAQTKAHRPENVNHPGISAFSYPEGDVARPKAPFIRDVFFNQGRENWEMLSVMEVDLYNRFTEDRSARGGLWRATIKRNGTSEELHIDLEPKTLDGRQSLPPLTSILRELLDGEEMANPDKLAARVAQLEAQLKTMAAA